MKTIAQFKKEGWIITTLSTGLISVSFLKNGELKATTKAMTNITLRKRMMIADQLL